MCYTKNISHDVVISAVTGVVRGTTSVSGSNSMIGERGTGRAPFSSLRQRTATSRSLRRSATRASAHDPRPR